MSRAFESRHRLHSALAGVLIPMGAPLGLLLLRTLVLGLRTPASIRKELASNRLIYLYVTGTTTCAFTLFGYVLGRQSDQLEQLSTTDPLTGLHNRRALSLQLEHEHSRSRRSRTPLSLLFVDVDNLKRINDRDGHAAGDRALRAVGNALAATLRSSDIGGRWGGDEFVVIAPNTTRAAAVRLAERLRLELVREAVRTTTSIGVATFDPARHPADYSDALLRDADAALQRAKAGGRNQVAVG